jgi:hypothetical protein
MYPKQIWPGATSRAQHFLHLMVEQFKLGKLQSRSLEFRGPFRPDDESSQTTVQNRKATMRIMSTVRKLG